jgi:hypothetical protein
MKRLQPYHYVLIAALMALGIIIGIAIHPVHAQAGTCCASNWQLPLPAGSWLITQGDKDSCVSSHCAPTWEINLYALDIVSADEKTISTMGASVLAPADGKVIAEFWDGYGGGNVLKIEHGAGGPVSVYLHLSSYIAALNSSVKQGDPVARIGNSTIDTNRGMGAHLHLTVLKSATEKVGLDITSWDGNTDFSTNAIIISTNGSGSPTVTPAPAAPGTPVLSQPGNNSNLPENAEVNLSWNTSTNASQYKVELWGGPYSLMIPCDWQSTITCKIGTILPGTFFWHVRARNSSGQESDWSNTWTFTIQGITPTPPIIPVITDTPGLQTPAAPTLRNPANSTTLPQSTDIWFEWNRVSGATQYYLEYWGGPYSTLNSDWINDTAYHIGTMWPGTYSWHVKARNSNGQEGNWSDTWTFTISQPPQIPTDTPQPVFSGNIAPQCSRNPDGINSGNAFDGNLSTFWVDGLGHAFHLELRLPNPMEITRILVWDRPQNSPDNNQINALIIRLSNGIEGRFGMDSGGRRCIDVTLSSPQTVSSVTLIADDASGNNGLSEVEIWVGPKINGTSCSNTYTLP